MTTVCLKMIPMYQTAYSSSGATYIYKRTGSTWVQEAYIKAANANAGDSFGGDVSISCDTLAVGAESEGSNQTTITNGSTASTDNSLGQSGAVYVYKRSGSTWVQEAYLKASNARGFTFFGTRLELNGNTLAVGVGGDASNQTTITNGTSASLDSSLSFSGAVFVYRRTGISWVQEAYVKSANIDSGDGFCTPSLSGDTLVVGAPGEDSNQTFITNGATASANNSNSSSGAVYIYRNNSRLYDPGNLSYSSLGSSSLTLTWSSAGRLATGYMIAYDQGSTPPANCSSGTQVNALNVETYNITGILPNTNHSFRVCAYDGSGLYSEGVTMSFLTLP